jgi:long-chain fatty acid transport protein
MKEWMYLAGRVLSAGAGGVFVLIAGPALATEGYFLHGYGVVSEALGGTGAAYSQDAAAQITNPAGLVNVEDQLNFGISFFSPHREFEAEGGGGGSVVPNDRSHSKREFFPIPSFAVSYAIDDVSAVGIALYGNGGLRTLYDGDDVTCNLPPASGGGPGVFCDGETGVDLLQLFLQPTYAREIYDGISIGAGPIFAVQRFEALGLSRFGDFGFSSDPDHLSDEGFDFSYGFGARFGLQAALPFNLRFGAAYQLRTYMSKFDKYRGLFAEQGDFDVPPALQLGVSWQPFPEVTLLFDYRRIWYKQVDSVGNNFFIPGPGDQLGDDDGPGFGWDNTNIFKVGLQFEPHEDWTLRAGYSYTDQPVDSSQVLFNILAPGIMRHHITAGIGYDVTEDITVLLGGFYAPSSSVTGRNPLDPNQEITLRMHQYEVNLGVSWQF